NGIGMDPSQMGQLFRVFRRLHLNDEYEGTGIDLAVSRRIMERHGGQIRAESEGEGKGSTFVVVFPA
ncbi:MAG: ATP-binding protein, partial [Rhodospirillaceae bacterium]